MTTATTATVVDMTTDAGFRNWVQEIITMLFTTLGVTQTTDTGQINTASVTRPSAANTSAGYVIGSFNDSHQTASPVYIKLEFGTGSSATTTVQMWITIGTGSNGSGTLTGVVGSRAGCGSGTPSSNTTAYTTRACYNATAGVLWLAWKMGGTNVTNQCISGFVLYRSADNTGASTTDSINLITNTYSGNSSSLYGYNQHISYLTNTAYYYNSPGTGWGSNQVSAWGYWPMYPASTLYNGNCQLGLCFQFTPVIGVTPWVALCLCGELAVGSTTSATIVGSTAHTYVSAGAIFGVSNFTLTEYSASGGASSSTSLLLLWE